MRKVIIYDPVTDPITGVYSSSVIIDGDPVPMDMQVVLVKVADNTYQHSDWSGGYYDQYYEYGPEYAMAGTMGISDDYIITHLSSSDPWEGEGDVPDSPPSMYDPITGKINYVYNWTWGVFEVELTKVN